MKPLACLAALALFASSTLPGLAQTPDPAPAAAAPAAAVPAAPAPPKGRGKRLRAAKGPADPATLQEPPAPKLTAEERREKAKLDHDLNICIGC